MVQKGTTVKLRASFAFRAIVVAFMCVALAGTFTGQAQPPPLGRVTVSSDIEGGYRKTQFSTPHYNTGVLQWDGRIELWLPPLREQHLWGPYVRVAGIAGTEPDSWQNAWLGGPGFGVQTYPLRGLLGPTRVFAEYNFTHYWGEDFPGQGTSWRPKNQIRAGFDYWKAVNVNSLDKGGWMELWNGLYWQSGNEFTDRYDSVLFANSGRFGIRIPNSRISAITPYLTVQSSLSKYRRIGTKDCFLAPDQNSRDPQNPCDFFWENRLLAGAGFRVAPHLSNSVLTRLVFYGEYLNTATYYGPAAPSSFPRYDILVGVSANIGDWYK
jgi:hypothetical protein